MAALTRMVSNSRMSAGSRRWLEASRFRRRAAFALTPRDMQALGQPSGLPMRPMLDIGVAARMAWELWQARAER